MVRGKTSLGKSTESAGRIKLLQLYQPVFPSPSEGTEEMRLTKREWEDRRGKWRHNTTTIYPSEPSLSPRSHFCHAVPVCCLSTNAIAQLSLRSSLSLCLCADLGNERWCSKTLQGTTVATVIFMWFMTSLLPLHSCQGATSPAITGVCLFD